MSTRYVWETYKINWSLPTSPVIRNGGGSNSDNKIKYRKGYIGTVQSVDASSGKHITYSSLTECEWYTLYPVTAGQVFYIDDGMNFPRNCYLFIEDGTVRCREKYGHEDIMGYWDFNNQSNEGIIKSVDLYDNDFIKSKGIKWSYASGTSNTLYPTDDISGSYWYTYKGSDNIDPKSISYPSTIKGGQSITLTTTKSSGIKYGGTITYTYEVQLNGGSWTSIGDSTSLTKSYTVPKGTITIRARVKARDNLGFTSTTYKTGSQVTVINNVAPVISGSNQNLGVFTYNPPVISYVVTDENNDTVTVTVKLDSSTLESRTVTLGQTYTVPINWWNIGTGSHTVTIIANDGQGGTATRTYTFTKNSVGLISFNRLHKKTDNGYQITYIESDSDSIITNNGQVLSERLESIASKLSVPISTTPSEMVSRHRLHIKLTSEYTIDYLEMYSTNIKVGSSTLESILSQLESKVGISNSGTVPSNLNFERWRMKNSSGSYDIIYLEGISEHVIRPCGKTVEESLQAIEAKL